MVSILSHLWRNVYTKLNWFYWQLYPLPVYTQTSTNIIWTLQWVSFWVGLPRKQILLAGLLTNAFGYDTCKWVRKAGLGKSRSWIFTQYQRRPQLVIQRVLELRMALQSCLNWGKGPRPLYHCTDQPLVCDRRGDKTLGKELSSTRGNAWEGTQLWTVSSQHSQQLGKVYASILKVGHGQCITVSPNPGIHRWANQT